MNDALRADRVRARRLALWTDAQEARLDVLVQCLLHWQKVINLVAPSTLDHIWLRHVADSAQLVKFVDGAKIWLDLGSGGGFPGIVAAILRAEIDGSVTHLVESDQRKCAFLREVSRETGILTQIHTRRIEDMTPLPNVNVVSARALASLPVLVDYSRAFLLKGAIGLFPRGQDVEIELTTHPIDSRFNVGLVPSQTDTRAKIAVVTASSLR